MSGLAPLQQQLRAMGPEYSNAASWTSYQLSPRASIFRRNFSDVVDVESMKHLMRSNDYATDKVCCLLGNRQAEADIYAALQAFSGHYQLDISTRCQPQPPLWWHICSMLLATTAYCQPLMVEDITRRSTNVQCPARLLSKSRPLLVADVHFDCH